MNISVPWPHLATSAASVTALATGQRIILGIAGPDARERARVLRQEMACQ